MWEVGEAGIGPCSKNSQPVKAEERVGEFGGRGEWIGSGGLGGGE